MTKQTLHFWQIPGESLVCAEHEGDEYDDGDDADYTAGCATLEQIIISLLRGCPVRYGIKRSVLTGFDQSVRVVGRSL